MLLRAIGLTISLTDHFSAMLGAQHAIIALQLCCVKVAGGFSAKTMHFGPTKAMWHIVTTAFDFISQFFHSGEEMHHTPKTTAYEFVTIVPKRCGTPEVCTPALDSFWQ